MTDITILVVQALTYYYRGQVKTGDIKMRQAIAAYKKAQRLLPDQATT